MYNIGTEGKITVGDSTYNIGTDKLVKVAPIKDSSNNAVLDFTAIDTAILDFTNE